MADPPGALVEDDPRWGLVQRVIASTHFVRAPRLSRFLAHICRMALNGREEEISEYQIGVQVFDRPKGYRPVEDNIVRNYARQLRRRLAEYFATDGQNEPLRIEIPLGSYVPVFVPHSGGIPATEPLEEHPVLESHPGDTGSIPQEPAEKPWWKRKFSLAVMLLVYSVVLVGGTATFLRPSPVLQVPAGSSAILWSSIFGSPLDTFIVPADCGFNILQDLSRKQVDLGGFLQGSYAALPLPALDEHSKTDLRTQEFTSFVDLQSISAIMRLPQIDPRRVFVRFARDLRMDDLKNGNVILLGSIGSNPWAEIAQRNLNFRIEYSKDMQQAWVVNMHPDAGEEASYTSHWDSPTHTTYAVIAYQPNLGDNGHLLLVQGLNVAGTQAAAEALLRGDILASVLRAASQKNGSLQPFEVLLQSTSIESNAANAQVIAFRIRN